jgi:hypothetical protein
MNSPDSRKEAQPQQVRHETAHHTLFPASRDANIPVSAGRGECQTTAAQTERFFSLRTQPRHTDPSRTRYGL